MTHSDLENLVHEAPTIRSDADSITVVVTPALAAALEGDGSVPAPSSRTPRDQHPRNDCTMERLLTGRVTTLADESTKRTKLRIVANTGAPMRRFWGSLAIDLDGVAFHKASLPLLLEHQTESRIGVTTSIRREPEGLVVEAELLNDDDGRAVRDKIAGGFPFESSIGVELDSVEEVGTNASAEANGRTYTGPISIARSSTLREVSIVSLGADGQTSVDIAASLGLGGMAEMRARWNGMSEAEKGAYWGRFSNFVEQYRPEVGDDTTDRLRAKWESLSDEARAEFFDDFEMFAWKATGGLERAERGAIR